MTNPSSDTSYIAHHRTETGKYEILLSDDIETVREWLKERGRVLTFGDTPSDHQALLYTVGHIITDMYKKMVRSGFR